MKRLFFRDKPIVGLDIGQTGAKIMGINTSNWHVLGYGSRAMDPVKLRESIETGTDYLAIQLKALLKNDLRGHLPSDRVVLSAPTGRTYGRIVTLPISAEKNLFEAVQLEAEQYIPVAVSELNIDYEVVERTKDTVTALMSAVPKKIIESMVGACNKAGLDVVMVEPGLHAISHLVVAAEEGKLPTIIADIGAASTNIAVFDNAIRITGGVQVGGNHFTLEIAKKFRITLEEAHDIKVKEGLKHGKRQAEMNEILVPQLQRITAEIKKIMRYYEERLGSKKQIQQLLIVGGGSNMPEISSFFTNELMLPARVAHPWGVIKFDPLQPPAKQYEPGFITAAGLALMNPKEIWK